MKKMLEEKLSKLNKDALSVICWISTVFSKAILIQIILGSMLMGYSYWVNNFYYNFYGSDLVNRIGRDIYYYVMPYVALIIVYFLLRRLAKFTSNKLDKALDKRKVFFATGVYLIIIQISSVLSFIYTIGYQISQAIVGVDVDVIEFVNIIASSLIIAIYILIGLMYMKKSGYFTDNPSEDTLEELS